MVVKIPGLPPGYLVMKCPENETYLLALEIEGEQQLKELHYFDWLPTAEECREKIKEEDWDVAISPA